MADPTLYTHAVRVRYAETDAMGVAHHSSCIAWLEEARIEALRSLGHSYAALEASGVLMPVIEINVQYRSSLRFDDVLTLVTQIEVHGPSRLGFQTRIECEGRLAILGHVTVAAVRPDGRPQRIPDALRSALTL